MMRQLTIAGIIAGVLSVVAVAQGPAAADPPSATVRIPDGVLAGGKPLPAGSYAVRVTRERPESLPGQSADAQRWVEFVANGAVVAREIAEVLPAGEVTAVGTAYHPTPGSRPRVEWLKSGEFLRVSIDDASARYLIHLPAASPAPAR